MSDTHQVLLIHDSTEWAHEGAERVEQGSDELSTDLIHHSAFEIELVARYDCIAIRHGSPAFDSTALLERVRREDTEIPIFVLGNADRVPIEEVLDAGATGFVETRPATSPWTRLRHRIETAATTQPHSGQQEMLDAEWLSESGVQSPTQLADALIRISDFVAVLTADGQIEYVNGGVERVLGYSRSELVGTNAFDYVHPDDRHTAFAQFSGLADGETGAVTIEGRLRGADDDWRWLRVSVAAVGPDGSLLIATGSDITERKEREQVITDLHQATRDFNKAESKQAVADRVVQAVRETLGHENNGVRFVSEDGQYLYVVTNTDRSSMTLGDRPRYRVGEGTAGRAFEQGETLYIEDLAEVDDEHPRSGISSGLYVPLGEHGTISIGAAEVDAFDEVDIQLAELLAENATVAMDRIDRLEDLQRQNELLDEFTGIVSHDLRNPLNVANGRLELARQEHDSDHLAAVADAHARMGRLINSLLEFAREGNSLNELEPVDVSDVASTCWTTVDTGTATLQIETEDQVLADRERLKQLLENLFANAIEHGGTDVTVRVGTFSAGIYIADDGPGIPVDERDAVFDAGYTTAETGTGFGLSIVKQIVDVHGWEIDVTESDAGGARFEIYT